MNLTFRGTISPCRRLTEFPLPDLLHHSLCDCSIRYYCVLRSTLLRSRYGYEKVTNLHFLEPYGLLGAIA